jgi:hypothetical protein
LVRGWYTRLAAQHILVEHARNVLAIELDAGLAVTEVFDCGPWSEELLRDGGAWIDGTNSVLESMTASLEMLEKISTD